jgi:hypothetical protein
MAARRKIDGNVHDRQREQCHRLRLDEANHGNTERFTPESELAELAAQWPAARHGGTWGTAVGE